MERSAFPFQRGVRGWHSDVAGVELRERAGEHAALGVGDRVVAHYGLDRPAPISASRLRACLESTGMMGLPASVEPDVDGFLRRPTARSEENGDLQGKKATTGIEPM
jgi:hypothetical protein